MLDRLDVCDGWIVHSPTTLDVIAQGVTLHVPACSKGCDLETIGSYGNRDSAMRTAKATAHAWGWEPCSHTSTATVEDVYGYNPWP